MLHRLKFKSLMLMLMIVWIFTGCMKSGQSLPNNYGKMISGLNFHEISIPFHENLLGLKSYSTTSYWPLDSIGTIVGYNHYTHSLDFLNLKESRLSHVIQLSKEGPNGIYDKVCGIYPYKKDSIWIYDHINFYLIDNVGNVRKKIFLGDRDLIRIDTNHRMYTAKFAYNASKHSLSFLVDKGNGYAINEYSIDDGQIINEYNLLPSVYNKDGKQMFADMNCPNVSFTNEKIIYNYPYESTIYVFNLQTKEHVKYGASSQYTTNIANECSNAQNYKMWEKHGVTNTHFYDVMYLSDLQIYVRPHLKGIDYNSKKSFQELGDSRELYLMYLNADFQIIGEFKMKDFTYSYFTGWCALPDAVLLFKNNSLSALEEYDKMLIDIIDVPVNR